ncbi:molybdenum cofactor guanylyltransferase MobA [uncultured Gilliamella sp.]|jgi:molybdopterin-guanine dinucleotide biosynthesis protein A, proteobacterial|uniref:molybdenum cofactor guanylyltransferase MobA n=1 Tax=uncultured Gilliamella sp. TaxID=1193505 RepID=UPI0025E76920|nr:molybdenum cofactor guanylyltransferase MobA [uncultured Gilliamella sp.]
MDKLPITAIVLAGGKSSRMNGNDKGLLLLNGKPLYQHVIDHIKYQTDSIMINCNRNFEQYQKAGYPIFADDFKGYLGPLSGIYSGLLHSPTLWNLFVSCDTPFLPDNLITRLSKHIATNQAVYPFDGKYNHPTILLINKTVTQQLKAYLEQGDRKLMVFLEQINAQSVDFSDKALGFVNINTPEVFNKMNQNKT